MSFDNDIDTHHEVETDRERVIGFLRKEAFDVRDCFTRYSVYMFMASAALVVAIARFTLEDPEKYLYVGLFGFFPALFLFLVLGMGAHKFGTSNRILGYELHLQRTGHYLERDLCHQLMKTVSRVGRSHEGLAFRRSHPVGKDLLAVGFLRPAFSLVAHKEENHMCD